MKRFKSKRREEGLTLVEVMIVVAILGIIAAIAIPSYSNYTIRARRTEAMNALTEMANLQERAFSNNGAYTTNFGALPYPQTTENGLYTLSPIVLDGTLGYTLTATPIAGGAQDGDGAYRLDGVGRKAWDKANNSSFGYDWTDR